MNIQRVVIASLCIFSCTCTAYTIEQCGSDGKFEINDTTAEVTIRCTGIGDDPVYLSISRSDGTTKTIASCPTKVCNNDPDFKVTREDDAIHAVKKGNVQSRDTLAGSLKCGRLGSASPAASCELRVVSYTIPQCGSDGKFEINDTAAEVTISCTGIGDDPVYLSISRSDGTTKTIASCQTKVCNNDPDFRVTREDDVIHAVKKGYVQSRDTLAGTLKCGRLGSASPAASCELRVVYAAAEVENCITEVNEDWTVSGSCQVNKMFASDGHYGCSWWRIPQGGHSTIFPGQMEVTDTLTENGKTYHRGLCSFAGQPMPTTAGHYGHTVKIDPGHQFFPGAGIDIKPPEGDPYISHCPTPLVEGDTLNCTCLVSSSNPGVPPAVVSWHPPPEIRSSLVIHNVTRSQDGQVFTCRQYWGGYDTSFGQEATYTLHVNYPPPSPPVITGLGTTITAGDSLSLTCTVSGGKPGVTSVFFYCGRHSDNPDERYKLGREEIVTSPLKIQSLSASENNTVCQCSANWDTRPGFYRKTARAEIILSAPAPTSVPSVPTSPRTETIVGKTTFASSTTPSLRTSPTPVAGAGGEKSGATTGPDNNNDNNSDNDSIPVAIIVGGAVGGLVLLIVIIVVIVFCRKRKAKSFPFDNTKGNNQEDDEFVEHINNFYVSADEVESLQPASSATTQQLPPERKPISVQSGEDETAFNEAQQTSQAASSVGAGTTQQHSDGQGDGTHGDLYSVVQKQKPSSKTSVKQTTPGPSEPTVPPSLPLTGTEEKPEVAGDEYGRLNFHRRASTELPGNPDTVYSHIGAP